VFYPIDLLGQKKEERLFGGVKRARTPPQRPGICLGPGGCLKAFRSSRKQLDCPTSKRKEGRQVVKSMAGRSSVSTETTDPETLFLFVKKEEHRPGPGAGFSSGRRRAIRQQSCRSSPTGVEYEASTFGVAGSHRSSAKNRGQATKRGTCVKRQWGHPQEFLREPRGK